MDQMKTCGEAITDQNIIEKIMKSETSKFDFKVMATKESKML